MIKESLNLIEDLKKKPQLVLTGTVDFYSIKTFLIGYVQGMGVVLNLDMHKAISRWFQKRVNQDSSFFWSEHITHYYEGESDSKKTQLFLETVESFFNENSTFLEK